MLILAVLRGGVPVGSEVAKALGAELDVLIARKLGLPRHPELAMGAIASCGARYLNPDVIAMGGVTQREIESVLADERIEPQRREIQYREMRPPVRIDGRVVIIVDDGIASRCFDAGGRHGAALTASGADRGGRAGRSARRKQRLNDIAGDFICVLSPAPFHAVGQFYETFDQTSDNEARRLLTQSRK